MKIDHMLRELFIEIASLDRSTDEWVSQYEYESFECDDYKCIFIVDDGADEPMGWFIFSCILRDYKHTAELTLEEVKAIASEQVNEIAVVPEGGVHPEDRGMRRVEVDSEILHNAIVDGINVYIRDVLRPRGIVDEDKEDADDTLISLKHDIARRLSKNWCVSWRSND